MNWKELSKNDSKSICDLSLEEQKPITGINDSDYLELKEKINKAFNDSLNEIGISKEELSTIVGKYKFDCIFGLKIYEIFTTGKYAMREREASNDDIWRYIQLKIVPEIISFRWKENFDSRMYSQSNRIYLKVLWWYCHLSMQDTKEETKRILMAPCNSSDTIVALVERTGKTGYRLDLYRKIMKLKVENDIDTQPFRKMMVLNSAMIKVLNPYLCENGIEGYVKQLIEKVGRN